MVYRMDLNLLSALDVLLTERNVTRAAERLHVTQPTMSGMLQRLRYQFDDQILVRNGRAMELTTLGSSLINPVREALRGVEALYHVEPAFDPATSRRTFGIMTADFCSQVLIPRIIARIADEAPNVRVEVRGLNAPIDKLVSGEVDIFIAIDELSLLLGDRPHVPLEHHHLFSDEFVCIVAADHPLDEHASLTEHLLYPHVGVRVGGNAETVDVASIRQFSPDYRPAFFVENFSLVPGIVARSRAVGVVQHSLARIASKSYDIRAYRPPYPRPAIRETMYWSPRQADDPANMWLRQILISEAKELAAER